MVKTTPAFRSIHQQPAKQWRKCTPLLLLHSVRNE